MLNQVDFCTHSPSVIRNIMTSFATYLNAHRRTIIAACVLVAIVCQATITAKAQSAGPSPITEFVQSAGFFYHRPKWPMWIAIYMWLGSACIWLAIWFPNLRARLFRALAVAIILAMSPWLITAIKQIVWWR